MPKESAVTNSNHFTMLGLKVATGEPVMCALIMKGKTIKSDMITGIDIFAEMSLGKKQTKTTLQTIQVQANAIQWDLPVSSEGRKFHASLLIQTDWSCSHELIRTSAFSSAQQPWKLP